MQAQRARQGRRTEDMPWDRRHSLAVSTSLVTASRPAAAWGRMKREGPAKADFTANLPDSVLGEVLLRLGTKERCGGCVRAVITRRGAGHAAAAPGRL